MNTEIVSHDTQIIIWFGIAALMASRWLSFGFDSYLYSALYIASILVPFFVGVVKVVDMNSQRLGCEAALCGSLTRIQKLQSRLHGSQISNGRLKSRILQLECNTTRERVKLDCDNGTPIECLGLPERVAYPLILADITTVEQLVQMPKRDILKVRRIGKKSFWQIMQALQNNNLIEK